jgi:hypothetical protein
LHEGLAESSCWRWLWKDSFPPPFLFNIIRDRGNPIFMVCDGYGSADCGGSDYIFYRSHHPLFMKLRQDVLAVLVVCPLLSAVQKAEAVPLAE